MCQSGIASGEESCIATRVKGEYFQAIASANVKVAKTGLQEDRRAAEKNVKGVCCREAKIRKELELYAKINLMMERG